MRWTWPNGYRANALGDFSKSIDDIVTGPAAQQISSAIREFELKELTKRATKNEWPYESQELLIECLTIFGISHSKLPTKSPLKNWFSHFTHLRNKTKGHGAPNIDCCAKAAPKLEKAINLIVNNFSAFKRPWVYLHRNLSGKYRVSSITKTSGEFDYLKKEKDHSFVNGIYIFLDKPRKVNLFYTNSEFTDFWISNGNLRKDSFETLSYISGEINSQDAKNFLQPVTQLPQSHTEGTSELRVINNCFTNLPTLPDFYVNRVELEEELRELLLQEDRFPIITLLGKGGIGKTSLALNIVSKLAHLPRFDLIIWFSARDIDLLIDGPKQVQTKVLNIKDISGEYHKLVNPGEKIKEPVQSFSNEMTHNSLGKALYVFDNFETVTNPIDVFEWINTYIRNPNKVLITSRISRNFKADYPIEIKGMNDDECHKLIDSVSKKLSINSILTPSYINEIITESNGHPYIIKILLGEVARSGKASKIKRIVADQEKILSALFKRTFNTLSPAAKRVFLTLCSWSSMVPMIAIEAILWRPENEKMDVQSAIEELRKSSFIDIIDDNGDDIINTPLAAAIFGKGELEVYPEKIKVYADRKLLIEFGTTTYTNLSNGVINNIERKFKAISNRINSIEEFQSELPILEYIASKYPKTYKYIIQVFEEYEDYKKVKYYLREYLKNHLVLSEKSKLWLKLADICKHTNDWVGESHALTELVQIPDIDLKTVSDVANRINNHIYNDDSARKDEYKTEMLDIVIKVFKAKLGKAKATDYSRLGWLLLNNNNPKKAKEIVQKGLEIEANNEYCQKLMLRLS